MRNPIRTRISQRVFTMLIALGLAAAVLPVIPAPAQEAATSCSKAGYGARDATYSVGSPAGQHAATAPQSGEDPHAQQAKKAPSYGVQSRLTVRAIVVQGCDGKTVALVKNDHYLAQDAVQRRIGQILAERESAVSYENVLMAASHNHSSPYPITPSWGVWAFQDAFDARAFEFFARQAAAAIMEAEANLQPARMGATEIYHDIFKGNVVGTPAADDGTPGGYPEIFGDHEVVVMRFDNAETGAPIASWVNWGQHPETLDGYDLITADFLGAFERFVDRETGAPVVFSQGDVGSAEGPGDGEVARGKWLENGTRRAWYHMGFAQAERGARELADSIKQGFEQIGAGGGLVPYSTDFEVGMYNGWIPYPKSHPYPSVSNCRSESTVEGNPGAPVVGLPDCERGLSNDPNNVLWENLKEHGIPVPEHYAAPSFTAVEENLRLRLQAVRLGDVLLGSCACEAQVDLIKNFESRADDLVGNIWNGYEWICSSPLQGTGDYKADHDWSCAFPDMGPGATRNYRFSDYEYDRMMAQIRNNAAGWDSPEYVPFANAEPATPSEIKGNFTWEEMNGPESFDDPAHPDKVVLPTDGYKLVVGIGHAGDYTGYTVSYREYMNRDHYRKALTCCGAHTADYMSTNLVYMGQALKGGPDLVKANPYNEAQVADEARQVAFSTALGQSTSAAYDAWREALPNDAIPDNPILGEPKDITRFDAATFTWVGGSNVADNPIVEVQHLTGDGWETYADQTGEVQAFVKYPEKGSGTVATYTGSEQWEWTANFEAFNFGPRTDIDPRGPQVPDGQYRFVVNGQYRNDRSNVDYERISRVFTVSKWEGIQVPDIRPEEDGSVSFTVKGVTNSVETDIAPGTKAPDIRYPRTYTPAPIIRMIRDDGRTDICKRCTFRPWAVGSDVATATVTIVRADGTREQIAATRGDDGRFHAETSLYQGDEAFVDRAGIVDSFGEINGEPSATVTSSRVKPTPTETETVEPTETVDPDPTETDPPASPTTVTFTKSSAAGGQYSDEALLQARLVDDSGASISGAELTFEMTSASDSSTWTSTTGNKGFASRKVTLSDRPGSYLLTVRYEGDDDRAPSADQRGFVIDKEDSVMTLAIVGKGKSSQLEARLADKDTRGQGIRDVTIRFFANDDQIGEATSGEHGFATSPIPPEYRGKKITYAARFAGNNFYRASGATARGK